MKETITYLGGNGKGEHTLFVTQVRSALNPLVLIGMRLQHNSTMYKGSVGEDAMPFIDAQTRLYADKAIDKKLQDFLKERPGLSVVDVG